MSLNFPNNPAVGQAFIAEGVSFTWTGELWVPTSTVPADVDLIKSGLPGANWTVVGDTLIQWGITRVNAIPQNLTLPKAFKTPPVATGSTDNSTDVNVTVWPDRVDRLVLRMFTQTGAAAPVGLDVYWTAIGEALDADKMPKTVQTAGGIGQFASDAEARAGLATDKVMSPATTQAAIDALAIGVAQIWKTISPALRPVDTAHQNTTGRPITLSLQGRSTVSNAQRAIQVSADGVNWVSIGALPISTQSIETVIFPLPNNHYWRILGALDAFYSVSELS